MLYQSLRCSDDLVMRILNRVTLQVSKVDVKFREIIHHYRSQPQSKLNVVRNVFIDQPPLCPTGVNTSTYSRTFIDCYLIMNVQSSTEVVIPIFITESWSTWIANVQKTGGLESGDIVKFYNDVFVHATKRFLVQLGSNYNSSPDGAPGLEGDDGKITKFFDDEFIDANFYSQPDLVTKCVENPLFTFLVHFMVFLTSFLNRWCSKLSCCLNLLDIPRHFSEEGLRVAQRFCIPSQIKQGLLLVFYWHFHKSCSWRISTDRFIFAGWYVNVSTD